MDGTRTYNDISEVVGGGLLKMELINTNEPQKVEEFYGSINADEDEQLNAIKNQFIELVNKTRKLVGDVELIISYRGYEVLCKLRCAFGGKDKFCDFCENNNISLKMENIEVTAKTYTIECKINACQDFFDDGKDYCLIEDPKEKRVYGFKSKLKPYDKRRSFKAKTYRPRIRSNPE